MLFVFAALSLLSTFYAGRMMQEAIRVWGERRRRAWFHIRCSAGMLAFATFFMALALLGASRAA